MAKTQISMTVNGAAVDARGDERASRRDGANVDARPVRGERGDGWSTDRPLDTRWDFSGARRYGERKIPAPSAERIRVTASFGMAEFPAWSTVGSLKTAIHNADPTLTASKLHSAEVAAVAVAIIFGLIGIGLWLWMAYANKAGKNWARITATVFFGLDTLSVLTSFRQAEPVLSRLISILIWLIGLGVIVLLYQRESSAYFGASKNR